jgi:hypothetical protein
MGLFNKKVEEKQEVPTLPELPEFPEFPKQDFLFKQSKIDKLPSYPSSSIKDKFSQDAIKEAVSGKEEVGGDLADEFVSEDNEEEEEFYPSENEEGTQMMQFPPEETNKENISSKKLKDYSEEIPVKFRNAAPRVKKEESLFIRIDKFQESLDMFEKIRERINSVERMLGNIQKIKEEEEKELIAWERELQTIKQQIEKIDSGIFSKIE